MPFSPVALEGVSHSCRTIILEFLKDSLHSNGMLELKKYLYGNSMLNDSVHGCICFDVKENGDVVKVGSHSCYFLLPYSCCSSVIKKGNCVSSLCI